MILGRKQASLEQLVVYELGKLENVIDTVSKQNSEFNSTIRQLQTTVNSHDKHTLKSMENNRRIFGQLGVQLNLMETRSIQTESLVNRLEQSVGDMVNNDVPRFKTNFEKAFKNV